MVLQPHSEMYYHLCTSLCTFSNFILQQDNARPHTAGVVTNHLAEHGITVMEWHGFPTRPLSNYWPNKLFSTEPFSQRKLKKPSTFNPVGPSNLGAMILLNKQTLNNRSNFRRPKWDNLTPGERRPIYDFKQTNDIVIKAADKGNAVVCVLQRED